VFLLLAVIADARRRNIAGGFAKLMAVMKPSHSLLQFVGRTAHGLRTALSIVAVVWLGKCLVPWSITL
jgi:hypothetical protein